MTEFSAVLRPPTSSSVRVGGLVVVVGSCDGTDSCTKEDLYIEEHKRG